MKKKWRLLNEPLLHFFLIGAAFFLLFGLRNNSTYTPGGQARLQTSQIIVSRGAIEKMNSQFEKTWQRDPTKEEQKKLIDSFIRNEIFYREAIAIGLDRDDEVIKRRLRTRMEFIYEDIASLAAPTDEDLRTFMKKHREKYINDPELSFRQVYIDMDKRDKNAESHARKVLAQLCEGADPDLVGDPTQLRPDIPLSPIWDIRSQFGDKFIRNLVEINPGSWEGPVRSGFGLHLVFIRERRNGVMPDLLDVREKVKQDWMAERQKELKDTVYAEIRERYTVIVDRPKALTTAVDPKAMK